MKCLNVYSCKLYNNKYMITSTQITSTDIFAFIAVLVFKLLSCSFFVSNQKKQKLLNNRVLFKKTANVTGKLK